VQDAASELFVRLTACGGHDLVPVSSVLLMAEHALNAMEASTEAPLSVALIFSVGVLATDGVWEQLEPDKATSLGIRALQLFGAPLPSHCHAVSNCMPVNWSSSTSLHADIR
jgi:hypothetical protein